MCTVCELLYVPVAVVNDGDMKVRILDVLVGMEPGQDFRSVTRPDTVVERCETNPPLRLASSLSYLSGNPNRLVT